MNVDFIIRFENGDLSDDELVSGFQSMIDDGSVWTLQGMYGITATMLINTGLCHARQNTKKGKLYQGD